MFKLIASDVDGTLLDRQSGGVSFGPAVGDGPRGFSYCNHLLGEVLLGYRVELGRDLFEG